MWWLHSFFSGQEHFKQVKTIPVDLARNVMSWSLGLGWKDSKSTWSFLCKLLISPPPPNRDELQPGWQPNGYFMLFLYKYYLFFKNQNIVAQPKPDATLRWDWGRGNDSRNSVLHRPSSQVMRLLTSPGWKNRRFSLLIQWHPCNK